MTKYNQKQVTREVYPPYTAGNPSSHWSAEIREHGLLVRFKYFETREGAEKWVKTAKHEKMDKEVIAFYNNVIKAKE